MPLNYRKNNITCQVSYYNNISDLNCEGVCPDNRVNIVYCGGTKYIGLVASNHPQASDLTVRVNNETLYMSKLSSYSNLNVSSPNTFSLNGCTALLSSLTISGAGTVVNVRSNASGSAQWSILEVRGNLTINDGATLNLIRTPLIVRGDIIGSGCIISPDGANGGTGGVGGPGGSGGGQGGYGASASPGCNGGSAPTSWISKEGTSGSSMPAEYGISSGAGGPGGRGTGGGGGGGGGYSTPYYVNSCSGGAAGDPIAYSGGSGAGFIPTGPGQYGPTWGVSGGGGGGTGGYGTPGTYCYAINGYVPPSPGGSGSYGITGNNGCHAQTLNVCYTGVGNCSPITSGSSGTFGGAGGQGYRWYAPSQVLEYPSNGGTGGSGGSGGSGGGTGGAHLSVYVAGTISSTIKIRPGKGGLTGGSTSLPRADSGSLWLFTADTTTPITTDVSGGAGTPAGNPGTCTRILTSCSVCVNDFYCQILYIPCGATPGKTRVSLI